ncbi:hypothetical protein GLUCOINTEAF2_0204065 [Komagataeibacter intermedius AF2]|uniref:Uncharacterized protein n=1 Tax=Komagataeibacter intermedius AF2 TaxID=1458464 RepID=A0A0C1V3B2_9PROT|nr:hypothetical protein GLUCOINTEAF2_0204065 [Komagataeibacter intermedius AF2]
MAGHDPEHQAEGERKGDSDDRGSQHAEPCQNHEDEPGTAGLQLFGDPDREGTRVAIGGAVSQLLVDLRSADLALHHASVFQPKRRFSGVDRRRHGSGWCRGGNRRRRRCLRATWGLRISDDRPLRHDASCGINFRARRVTVGIADHIPADRHARARDIG